MTDLKKKIDFDDILIKSGNVAEWKVPGFFSLPKYIHYYFESPPFLFLESTWCLQCYLDAAFGNRIYVYLKRIHSLSDHTLTIRLGIRTNDGAEISKTFKQARFPSDGSVVGSYIFTPEDNVCGKDYLLSQGGCVTLSCVFPPGNSEGVASRTVQSNDVATNTEEDCLKKLDDGECASTKAEGIEKLSQSFKNIFVTGDHHDTLIKVQYYEFRAHKLVLIVRSPVFESMFRHDTVERNTDTITIEDCDPEAFQEFLSFLYSGKVENVSAENVTHLYSIADKCQVDEVKSECVKFMTSSMSVENFCDFISLALLHREKDLLNCAAGYFAKNVKKIIKTVQWLSFLKEHPVEANELHIKALKHLDPDEAL